MDGDKIKILESFENKLRHLLVLHKDLKDRYKDLEDKYEQELENRNTLNRKYTDLSNKYIYLKAALVINPNRQDIGDTQRRLSKLVREVDTCIELINKLD